jgi:endonuclease III
MTEPSKAAVAKVLLQRHGQTFAEELEIDVEENSPSALFRLLCAALLMSARISNRIAVQATKALADQGWTTPEALGEAGWEARARALKESGYARYDERTSTMLGDTVTLLLERYQGDLRNLRTAAERDPRRAHKLLKEFKGIGDVGANIFLREVQVAWDELFPFADQRTLEQAAELGLPGDVDALVNLAGKEDFPRLVAAVIRTRLARDQEDVLAEARTID